MSEEQSGAETRLVRHFRQILLWPLHLMPPPGGSHAPRRWEELGPPGAPWAAVEDEFPADAASFQVRHYNEFTTFLPAVQRFLYGDPSQGRFGESPIRVFRRADVGALRATFKERPDQPVTLSVAHVDLCFFYDIDVVMFTVEVFADDLPFDVAQELVFRLGRSFPTGWDHVDRGDHCLARAEWLGPDGAVVAASDFENRGKFLSVVCRERAPAISADWKFLVAPLVPDSSDRPGTLRFRQLEYARMPVMAYLAMDKPLELTRGDFARLVLATRSGPADQPPCSDNFLATFDEEYCYDRFWGVQNPTVVNTRFLCSGQTLVVVGEAGQKFFVDPEQGVLAQFRHQYFLVVLIAHFHKAALLMFADRLSRATCRLDIRDPESVREFKRAIRQLFATFLRFTHRYWFHEVSIQAQAKAIFAMCRRHLGTDALYDHIRLEVQDMAHYLEADGLRRQANTVVRLTVVTVFGMIGSVATGLLGTNLIAAADEPTPTKLLYGLIALVPTTCLILYTVMVSKQLSDMLEALSERNLSVGAKVKLFFRAWAGGKTEG